MRRLPCSASRGNGMHLVTLQDLEHVVQQEAFLQSVSHEMKTPLSGIIGITDALIQSRSLLDHQVRLVEHMKSAGQQLLQIIDDILDLRAGKTGDLKLAIEPVSISEVVNHVVSVLTPLKRPEVSLSAELQGFIPSESSSALLSCIGACI